MYVCLLVIPVKEAVALTAFYSRHPKLGCHFPVDPSGPLFRASTRFPE